MSCKLVKHLVTSRLVQVEAAVCNMLFRRGCAVVKLSMKEVVGRKGGGPAIRRTSILVCCVVADLRLTHSPLHAALLLPPEFVCFFHWQLWFLPRWMSAQLGPV